MVQDLPPLFRFIFLLPLTPCISYIQHLVSCIFSLNPASWTPNPILNKTWQYKQINNNSFSNDRGSFISICSLINSLHFSHNPKSLAQTELYWNEPWILYRRISTAATALNKPQQGGPISEISCPLLFTYLSLNLSYFYKSLYVILNQLFN